MKNKKNIFSRIFILFVLGISPLIISWGTFGHEHINHAAVLALPSPLQSFFYNHIDFITQESTVPDLRKYTLNDKAENPRHYIDLENFGSPDSLPNTLAEVKKKYDEKFLQQNGFLPWYIEDMMDKLTKAFKEKRKTEILFLASDLGHYIGDAHMPLHTSVNHDGQLTDQKGIHSFWETRLPELFGSNYNYHVSEAKYIEDVPKETWKIILNSHRLADTVLLVEKKIRKDFPENKIYEMDSDGKPKMTKFNQKIFSAEYAKVYSGALHGMVERQLRNSISETADFWYTAWVNAGKPSLDDLDPAELTKNNNKQLKKEIKTWEQGKLSGIESEKEN